MEATDFENYGTGRNPKCGNCMTHCGYEPTAVTEGLSSVPKMIELGRAQAAAAAR